MPRDVLTKAKKYYKEGKLKEALSEITKNETIDHGEEQQIEFLLLKSAILNKLGKNEEALKLARQALGLSLTVGNGVAELDSMIEIANDLYFLGNLTESTRIIDESFQLLAVLEGLPETEVIKRKALLEKRLGAVHYSKGNLKTALMWFEKSLQNNKLSSSHLEVAGSTYNIASLYSQKGDLARSIKYFQEAATAFQDIGNRNMVARALSGAGAACADKGDFKAAFNFLTESKRISEEINDKYTVGITLLDLTLVSINIGELDQAEKYCTESRSLLSEYKDKYTQFRIHMAKGVIYFCKGDLLNAEKHYMICLSLQKALGNRIGIARFYNNLGLVFEARGELDRAKEYIHKALDIFEETGSMYRISMANNNLGTVYFLMGDITRSLACYEKALSLRILLGNPLDISATLFRLIERSIEIQAFDKAREYFQSLEKIRVQESHRIISHRYQLAKALLILNNFPGESGRQQAQSILEKIAGDDVALIELTIMAIFSLCKITFERYLVSGEQVQLKELESRLNSMLEMADRLLMRGIYLSTLFMKAKLSLVMMHTAEGKDIFQDILTEAKEKGAGYLAKQCENELANYPTYEMISELRENLSLKEKENFQNQQAKEFAAYLNHVKAQLTVFGI
ncbi:MAG: tetratricopeptide repeat protein [Candidatus Odinarchaeota archaeon]